MDVALNDGVRDPTPPVVPLDSITASTKIISGPTVQPKIRVLTPPVSPIKPPLIGKRTLLLCAILILMAAVTGLFLKSQQNILDNIYQPTAKPALNSLTPTLTTASDVKEIGILNAYVNHDYGYSIKYPTEMEVSTTIKKPKEEGFVLFSLPAGQYVTPTLRIQHLKNSEKLSANAFFDKLSYQEKRDRENKGLPPTQEPNMSKEIEIGGVQAFQFTVSQGDGDAIHTYIAKEDFIVDIEFTDYGENDPKNQEHLALFNRMLSTFKFTKAPQAINYEDGSNLPQDVINVLRKYYPDTDAYPKFNNFVRYGNIYIEVSVQTKYPSGFAVGLIKRQKGWVKVWAGQDRPACTTLELHLVPSGIECARPGIDGFDETHKFIIVTDVETYIRNGFGLSSNDIIEI